MPDSKRASIFLVLTFIMLWAPLGQYEFLMIAGMIGTNFFNLYPEIIYFIVLVAWSVVPLFLYLSPHKTMQPAAFGSS